MFGTTIVGYWPCDEPSGTILYNHAGIGNSNALNGVISSSRFVYPGIGDRRNALNLNVTTGFLNIYTADLNSAFSKTEGAVSIWVGTTSTNVWTDGLAHFIFSLATASALDTIVLQKTATNGTLSITVTGNSTARTKTYSIGTTLIGWFHFGLTWSSSGGYIHAYVNGVEFTGATELAYPAFSAGALLSTQCVIGNQTTSASVAWQGSLAHCLLLNRAISANEMLDVYNYPIRLKR
jgi:hypothetical protein